MFPSLVIAYREALEAVLILVPMLAYVVTVDKAFLKKYIYSGSLSGLFISVLGGIGIFSLADSLTGATKQIFDGSMLFFVAGLILFIVIWMQGSKKPKTAGDTPTLLNLAPFPLFFISFLTVFKEGLEVVVFTVTSINQHAINVALGTCGGVVLAVFTAFIIFKTAVKLNITLVFKAMSLILLFIGAEMFGEALVAFWPRETSLETAGFLAYLIPSMYVFLRSSAKEFLNKYKG